MKTNKLILSLLSAIFFLISCGKPSPDSPTTPPGNNKIGATIFVGTTEGKFYALNAADGSTTWMVPVGGIIYGSASMVGNLVVFVTTKGYLYAVNVNTGVVESKTALYGGVNGASKPPTVKGNLIYVSTEAGIINCIDTTTQLINGIKTATVKWYKSITTTAAHGPSAPTVSNGMLVAGTPTSIYAMDAATGAFKWECAITDGSTESNPAIVNNVVYAFGQNNTAYAINASTGNIIWQHRLGTYGGAYYCSPLISGNTYYINGDTAVMALDINNGAIKWASEGSLYAENPNGVACGLFNGVIYVNGIGFNNYGLWALDAQTGKLKWSYSTGTADIATSPTAADDFVVTCDTDGFVYLLDAATGALRWKKRISQPRVGADPKIVYSSPTVLDANGVLHLPTESGELN